MFYNGVFEVNVSFI